MTMTDIETISLDRSGREFAALDKTVAEDFRGHRQLCAELREAGVPGLSHKTQVYVADIGFAKTWNARVKRFRSQPISGSRMRKLVAECVKRSNSGGEGL